MAEIGKSLVFYNQYFAEMNRLYEEKKTFPEIKKRRDRGLIRKKIIAVGDAAGKEARHLLEQCIKDTKVRLEGAKVARLIRTRRVTTEEKYWEVGFRVFAPYQKKSRKNTRQIGITLTNEGLTPWVWCHGGRNVEDRMKSLFATGVRSVVARDDGWIAGTVPLRTVPIPWGLAKNFTLDSAGFIEQTRNVCEAFTPRFIKKLLAAEF